MSDNVKKIIELSKRLGEPEWLLLWRQSQSQKSTELSKGEMYGIAIPALELIEEQTFSAYPEYSVDASKGLELYTWKEALMQEEISPIIERLFVNPLFPNASSRDQAIGRANFQSGLVIYVQPTLDNTGSPLSEKLTLTSILPLGAASDVVIVIVKEGAQFEMKSIMQGGEASSVFVRTFITVLESDASCSLVEQSFDVQGFVNIEHTSLVAAHSSSTHYEDASGVAQLRSVTSTLLLGEEAKGNIAHTLIASGNKRYDILARTLHHASNTSSTILAAGVGADASKTVYRGAIDMKGGVKQTSGTQEGKFLILSDKAEFNAVPALDIAANEVKSTHKLSISHIRDTDLFYAKTRGLDDTRARETALSGFFGELFQKLGKEEIIKELEERITASVLK